MSRLKSKEGGLHRLVGKVDAFRSRIGEYEYVVLFKNLPMVHGKRVSLVYPRNSDDGWFTGTDPYRIHGKRIRLAELPTHIINDIKRNV